MGLDNTQQYPSDRGQYQYKKRKLPATPKNEITLQITKILMYTQIKVKPKWHSEKSVNHQRQINAIKGN